MYRLKDIWVQYYAWILIGLTIVVPMTILIAHAAAPDSTPRMYAEPSTETEITFDMEQNRAYTADDGIVVIGDMGTPIAATTGEISSTFYIPANATDAAPTPAPAAVRLGSRYTLPEDAMLTDGSIGVLSIPAIRLAVNVYETDDEMEAMTHGLAHFKITSAWSGNVGLCGHNVNFDLTDGFFKNLHTLKQGDTITYRTALGSRTYAVETIAEIAETDWSYLGRTEDDRITLITCISGKPTSRLVVQAVAIN